MDQLFGALEYAARLHRDQRRKDDTKEPYINHPIRVASYLTEAGVENSEVLSAALLHDVLEDCPGVAYDDIVDTATKYVADLVQAVTDNKSLPKAERKRLQVEKMKSAPFAAKMIKIADKIDNVSCLIKSAPAGWTQRHLQGYVLWSAEVVNACTVGSQTVPIIDKLAKKFQQVAQGMDCTGMTLEEYYKLC